MNNGQGEIIEEQKQIGIEEARYSNESVEVYLIRKELHA